MSRKRKNNTAQSQISETANSKNGEQKPHKSKFLLIFICIFLAAVLILGVVLGIVIGVREAGALVKYEGEVLDLETTMFFVSYYKTRYLAMLRDGGITEAEDTEAFWASPANTSGNSYGDFLVANTRIYLKQLLVANQLFDKYAGLSSGDRAKIDQAIKDVINYKVDGGKPALIEAISELGFGFSAFQRATTLLYKATVAKKVIYGEDGSKLISFPELCEDQLDRYSHVKLLFIKTERDLLRDENGNTLKGDDGHDLTYELTESEKAERLARAAEIRAAIAAYFDGEDGQMTDEAFDNYLKTYGNGDHTKDEDGYYFMSGTAYTEEFREKFPTVVDAALSMGVGDYSEVNTSVGICFIHRIPAEDGAYLDTGDGSCFDDFYKQAVDPVFNEVLEELGKNVVFTDKFNEIDIISVKPNTTYIPLV